MSLRLSVVICTKNRSRDLEITLHSIFEQCLLPDHLVIIDDGNAEETLIVLKKFNSSQEVRFIYNHPDPQSSGLPAARNQGIKTVLDLTDIILFLDDDVTLENTYLETIRNLFQKNPDACGVTGFMRNEYHGRSLPVKGLLLIAGCILPSLVPVSLYGPCISHTAETLYPLFHKPGAQVVPAQWLSGCNMAYRASVFFEGAGFDEQLIRYALGEDMLFSHRLCQDGKKLLLDYNAHLTHRVSKEARIPPIQKIVMMFGYRRYAIATFIKNSALGPFWYAVFVLQCILSSFVLSAKYGGGLTYTKEVIRAYWITRPFEHEIGAGKLERFNTCFSLLA
jgi:GT2 family glycosyltransferase